MIRAAHALAVVALLSASTAEAQSVADRHDRSATRPMVTSDPAIIRSLDRIARGSRAWREALEVLASLGRQVIIATPEQVHVAGGSASHAGSGLEGFGLAEVAAVPPGVRVDSVLVVVNVRLLDRLHRERQSLDAEADADLDRILIHEVYGHAIPYLLAGSAAGRCADPAAGQPVAEACSIRRENVVRQELGLGYRTDYGLNGLFLTRR